VISSTWATNQRPAEESGFRGLVESIEESRDEALRLKRMTVEVLCGRKSTKTRAIDCVSGYSAGGSRKSRKLSGDAAMCQRRLRLLAML